jgi:hypothetical protein
MKWLVVLNRTFGSNKRLVVSWKSELILLASEEELSAHGSAN